MRLTTGIVLLLTLGFSAIACAPPEPVGLAGSKAPKKTKARAEADDDAGDDSDGEADGNVSSGLTAAPPSTTSLRSSSVNVSFLGSRGQTFQGVPIARICSDRGADFSNATFIDATSISLVGVDAPYPVLTTIAGADFQKLKQELLTTGTLDIPVDHEKLPTEPYEYAIIAGGDGRFGSPTACGSTLKPGAPNERDIEEFPTGSVLIFGGKIGGTGCGTVGYIQTYYDATKKEIVSIPTSQLLLAADDEGGGGFPVNSGHAACDGHDSPLVLDLGGRGVSLGTPIAGIFDVDGDGRADTSPWVTSDDTPFLVRDANGNGVVDGVGEMFGNRTRGPDGQASSRSGFEALGQWDDGDGVIDARDPVWATLRLWFDRNHDGVTDAGELETLPSRGVRAIALSYVDVKERLSAGGRVQGAVRQRGGATMDDGRVVNVVDVWFERRAADLR